jgi:hypothetical protein
MRAEKPVCQSGRKWIRDRVLRETGDKYGFAALTGQDAPALSAFVHLVQLWGNSDNHGRRCAIAAMYHTVQAMQPSTRHLAKAGIPHVLDWSHEDQIWVAIQTYAATADRSDS